MKEQELIEEISVQELEQRIEFSCCGGFSEISGSNGDPSGPPCNENDWKECQNY